MTGTTTPSLRKKLVRAFSPPLAPSFGRTGDNALPLTAFALAFSPVCPLSENDGKTTEFASLILFSPRKPRFRRRVRGSWGVFSRRMSGKRRISYFDEETTGKACFLFVLLFRAPCGAAVFTLAREYHGSRELPESLPYFTPFTVHL